MEICTVVTRDREEMVDITERLRRDPGKRLEARRCGTVFASHTTCGLTINEGRSRCAPGHDGLFQPHHTAPGRMAAWGRQQRRAH